MNKMDRKIKELIGDYNSVVKVIDKDAKDSDDRSYGGMIRSVKGKLQEHITEEIVKVAWEDIGGCEDRININSKKQQIHILKDYVKAIENNDIKKYILSNIDEYYYGLSVDKQVFIDGDMVIGIECKSYTENAMIKRILVDFSLLKTIYPKLHCYLFQLESQLGGDYSDTNNRSLGSTSTHTLMSYFKDTKLNIITFLKGERKVDRPIHKPGFFKPLKKNEIKKAITQIQNDLKQYL